MKVLVLGSTGMLGFAVSKMLMENGFEVDGSYRNKAYELAKQLNLNKLIKYDAILESDKILTNLTNYKYVVNCIGVIKPYVNKNTTETIFINSYLPHLLAKYHPKLIQITTDCVFSGRDGKYNESSIHDEMDLYGRSKSLGEPNNCMVIRTSIIGEELHNHASLISWAKSQKGNSVNGFINHHWNGITTKQYGRVIIKIINNELYNHGLYHVYSPVDITKYGLLKIINERFQLRLDIKKKDAPVKTNRTLRTNSKLNTELNVPDLLKQF